MKVLHIFGGVRTFKIAKWQALKGLKVHKVMIEDSKPFKSYFKNTNIVLYKNDRLTKIYEKIRGKKFLFSRLHLFLYPFYSSLINKAIKKSKPDIVHAYRHTGAFLAILAKKIYRFKTKIVFDYQDPWSVEDLKNISWIHRGIVNLFYRFENFIIKNSDFIITQGEEQTEMLIRRYNISSEKISHTWNTADKNVFKKYKDRSRLRKQYGLGKDIAILYLGSIVKTHGVDMIPKTAKEIVKKFPNTKFVMMGVIRDKEFWEKIKKEIKSYGLEKNFIEIYPEKKSDIPKLISMCDIGLILHKKGSLIGETSLPSKLFEYMGCGLAIVTSNRKHITRFVIPEKAGLEFEANDIEDLVETLRKLLKNPKKIKNLGENARKAVEKKFNWDKDMERLLNVYNSLIK